MRIPKRRQFRLPSRYLPSIILFLLFIFFLAAVYAISVSSFFKVQEIEIAFAESKRLDKAAVEGALKSEVQGKDMLFLNTRLVEKNLKQKILPLDSVKFKKNLPKRLEVEIKEREPLLRVKVGEGIFLADKNGLLFAMSARNENLPLIVMEGVLNLGDYIDSKGVVFILHVLTSISPESVQEVSFQEEGVVKLRSQETDIYFTVEKDVTEQLEILRVLEESYKIKGKRLKRIDLRFGRPVISY